MIKCVTESGEVEIESDHWTYYLVDPVQGR